MVEDRHVEEAKRAVAGPLGEKMARFPLLFAKAAFFGQRPSRARPAEIRSGTITLADLGAGPIGITCQHVIAHYREQKKKFDDVLFQIGNVEVDPQSQLVDEDARLDLAVLRLSEEQACAITSEGEIGSCFFRPKSWPSPTPVEEQFVAFGGFPAKLKTVVSFDELEFGSWSSGGSKLSSVSEDRLVSAFERSYWVSPSGARSHMDLTALGGMSGGPAFINRGLYWDLVGIVSDYNENYDAVLFASATRIRQDGTIGPPTI